MRELRLLLASRGIHSARARRRARGDGFPDCVAPRERAPRSAIAEELAASAPSWPRRGAARGRARRSGDRSWFEAIGESLGDRRRARTVSCARARRARTPAFMPVGTKATVKAVDPTRSAARRRDPALQHLPPAFRPGADLIAGLGGLHHFMAWDGPILTDSRRVPGLLAAAHDPAARTTRASRFRSVYDGDEAALHAGARGEHPGQLGSNAMCSSGAADAPRRESSRQSRTTLWAKRQQRGRARAGRARARDRAGRLDASCDAAASRTSASRLRRPRARRPRDRRVEGAELETTGVGRRNCTRWEGRRRLVVRSAAVDGRGGVAAVLEERGMRELRSLLGPAGIRSGRSRRRATARALRLGVAARRAARRARRSPRSSAASAATLGLEPAPAEDRAAAKIAAWFEAAAE